VAGQLKGNPAHCAPQQTMPDLRLGPVLQCGLPIARLPPDPISIGTQGEPAVSKERQGAYWKANLRLMAILLAIWFIVSYGAGILFVDFLDQFQFAGFPLGFWFAQQGSIYVFVVLIFVYVRLMNKMDREHDVHED
jgi:putative solute:sodium symporter small subunit